MTSSAVRITLSPVRDWKGVELLWRELECEARPSFFRSWTWIGCLAEERFPDPVLLRAERDNCTVGLAVLNRVRGRFGAERLLLSESGAPTLDAVYIEHNGVLLAPGSGDLLPECMRTMISAPIGSEQARSRFGSGRQLRLSGVDASHVAAARRVGKVRILRESAAPFVDLKNLPAPSDGYLASLSANTRYQIRRSNRTFARLGDLEVREATSVEEALSFLDALAALHQSTWNARGLPGAFGNPSFIRFHRALVARALPRGEVVLLRISHGSQILGYLYNFRLNGNVVAYQSGFDYPAAAKLDGSHAKPGLTCHYAAVLRALDEGADVYDFLAGPDRYKRSLTRTAQPLFWIEIAGQSPLSSVAFRLPSEKERQTQERGNVLVLGDDTRAFLAIVRSLGRRGINVHAAPANFRSPALASRYIRMVHDLPPWTGNGAEWLEAMRGLLSRTPFDLVIPCNETTLLPLQRHRAELEGLTRLAIPDDHAISVLFDKHATRELSRRVGVPIAAGRLLRSNDTAEMLIAELGSPVVLKPRRSYSLETLGSRGKVQVGREPAQLSHLMNQFAVDETVVEQFFLGQGVGISVLASRGRVLQAFEHHRVHETAGASFYRVSATLNPDKLAACEAIVAEISYTGLAMFEFKHNANGQWILLEVNARPWGSMPLPQALGIDFPYRWFRLLTRKEEIPAVPYSAGIYGRNLVPDLVALKAEATSGQLGRVAIARFTLQRAIELLRPISGREVHDVFVGDDPRPAFVEFANAATGVNSRIGRLIPPAATRQRRARQQVRKALREADGELRILFICAGNICRSPFAAALLRDRLNDRSVRISSAGMMPQPGRSTPDLGLKAAAGYGIDLSRHRSVWLARDAARAAALIFVFDEANRTALLDRYPKIRAQVVSLGDLSGAGIIRDPIDGDLDQFEHVYRSIVDAITILIPLLHRERPISSIPKQPHDADALTRERMSG